MSVAWDYATVEGAPGHTNFGKQVTSGGGANNVTAGSGTHLVFKRDSMREVYVPARFTNDIAGSGSTDYSHVYYKHRVRGRGKAFQVLFTNDGDKDYNLIGWAEQFHGKAD